MGQLDRDIRLDIPTLQAAYRDGARFGDLAPILRSRIEAGRARNAWISLADDAALAARATELDDLDPSSLPLYGVPFAVKDNIDVAGHPTTAACPGYAYVPERSATAVTRLEAAGAVYIGKTNLDQFATGLSGVRSPYGACSSVFNADYISGGSSSGSAVAVASGMVSLALGTDTGGSGRVPAGWNNVVGLKPTRGVIPASGLVPNCRTLDCVSVFGLTVSDTQAAYAVMAGPDDSDPFCRRGKLPAGTLPPRPGAFRFGVPADADLTFLGDEASGALFAEALARLSALGGRAVPIDYTPFREAGALMFDGPWVAERLAALRGFVDSAPDALLPITRRIIEGAERWSAADAFDAIYRLEAMKRAVDGIWRDIDILAVPTAPRPFTHAELREDPIGANNAVGTYSYCVNLLDLAAIAIPNGFHPSGVASGITLIGPALSDPLLGGLAAAFEQSLALPPGIANISL